MKIAIDARMYGLEHAGIGRYVKNIVTHLIKQNSTDRFTIFLPDKYGNEFADQPHVTLVPLNTRHYTLLEQVEVPLAFNRYAFDLLHVPHFNVPLIYRKPFVVTIHDLLWHQVKGPHVTTLSPLVYALKHYGYRATVRHAVTHARRIIVPSHWVKKQLIQKFPGLSADKITVIYEAVDDTISPAGDTAGILQELGIGRPFIVYTGSAYPHKNLTTLIDAVTALKSRSPLNLVIVSSRSVFSQKLQNYITNQEADAYVKLVGFLPDTQLAAVYQQALALCHPSYSEGFGLTGLEAMKVGLPVVSSTAGALPEIYGEAALYADPDDVSAWTRQLQRLLNDPQLIRRFRQAGRKQAASYSWRQTARQTLNTYHQALESAS